MIGGLEWQKREKKIFSIVIKGKKITAFKEYIILQGKFKRNGTNSPYFAKGTFEVFQYFTQVDKNTSK